MIKSFTSPTPKQAFCHRDGGVVQPGSAWHNDTSKSAVHLCADGGTEKSGGTARAQRVRKNIGGKMQAVFVATGRVLEGVGDMGPSPWQTLFC